MWSFVSVYTFFFFNYNYKKKKKKAQMWLLVPILELIIASCPWETASSNLS